MKRGLQIVTPPEEVAADSNDLSYALRRATEKTLIDLAIRKRWKHTDPLDPNIPTLREGLLINASKLRAASSDIELVLGKYDRHIEITGPAQQFEWKPPGMPDDEYPDDMTVSGVVTGINYEKAHIALISSTGGVAVKYALITNDPQFTYPVVEPAVTIEVPGQFDRPLNARR